ncbi:NAD(P)/FAD-dependent oxidoreductase [Agrococcus sp. TF02-05]|uniref:NAD(P)/FAD-dependent oxidoreductase n=1 Tax=Agrococcus sp. TF02-05 TaxID=2815211 RepID=UPI001AA14D16|nr:NAD(P)/FAD-dependent oxidoreductase [Agrococcus sp. TF02-05]MBO1770829.1 NAD(P)/FAD-dependent oxidoreductase [Agrococcus sp. TF02-05]
MATLDLVQDPSRAGSEPLDCIVVGGGPAGLQAALTLARVHRSVALVDAGPGRNASAAHMHNVVSRDGTPPAEFRTAAREQLAGYATVRLVDDRVAAAEAGERAVAVELASGERLEARFLLLATGVADVPLPLGLARHWGGQVAHCPFCHGHELGDRVVVLGGEPQREHVARIMAGVAEHVTWLTDGLPVDQEARAALAARGIEVDERRATGVVEDGGRLTAIELEDGTALPCTGVLAGGDFRQGSTLPEALACAMRPDGTIEVDMLGRTSVPRVLAAGDAALSGGHSVIAAAAAGQLAAAGIVRELIA